MVRVDHCSGRLIVTARDGTLLETLLVDLVLILVCMVTLHGQLKTHWDAIHSTLPRPSFLNYLLHKDTIGRGRFCGGGENAISDSSKTFLLIPTGPR